MSQKTAITLNHPFEFAGRKITEVSVRRPKTKDMIGSKKLTKTEEDAEILLFANLSEVEPGVFEEMDFSDYLKVQKVVQGFFS